MYQGILSTGPPSSQKGTLPRLPHPSTTILSMPYMQKTISIHRKSLYRHARHCKHTKGLEEGEKNPQKKCTHKAATTTIPSVKDAFLISNVGDFNRVFSPGEDITWQVLPKDVVYLVQKLTCLETKWGQRTMLHLENNYKAYKVWTPNNIADILTDRYSNNNNNFDLYIKPSNEKVASIVLRRRQLPPPSLPPLQILKIQD